MSRLKITHLITGCYKDLENASCALIMTKELVELDFLIDFWSNGPGEEENVYSHARWSLVKANFDIRLERLKRFEPKANIPDDLKIKLVYPPSLNLHDHPKASC
jgi:hypothetical protein